MSFVMGSSGQRLLLVGSSGRHSWVPGPVRTSDLQFGLKSRTPGSRLKNQWSRSSLQNHEDMFGGFFDDDSFFSFSSSLFFFFLLSNLSLCWGEGYRGLSTNQTSAFLAQKSVLLQSVHPFVYSSQTFVFLSSRLCTAALSFLVFFGAG